MTDGIDEIICRTLMQMERIREASYEADSPAEERRLVREYGKLSKFVMPLIKKRDAANPLPQRDRT